MPKTIYRPEYRRLLDQLRQRREAKGISQTAAAAALGWSQQKFSAAEVGARRLDVFEYIALARFLGLVPSRALALAEAATSRTSRGSVRRNA